MFRRDPHFTRFESPIAEAFPPSGKGSMDSMEVPEFSGGEPHRPSMGRLIA